MVGFCEFISACFLLWAILKLHVVSGRNLTLRELLNQKFVTVHIVTLLVYLTSIAIYYTYFGLWSTLPDVTWLERSIPNSDMLFPSSPKTGGA